MKIKINNIEKLRGETISIRHPAKMLHNVTFLCEHTVENIEESSVIGYGWVITLGSGGYVIIMDEVDSEGNVMLAMKSTGNSTDIWGAGIRLEELRSMDGFVKALRMMDWK
jgi:hypothetical protein